MDTYSLVFGFICGAAVVGVPAWLVAAAAQALAGRLTAEAVRLRRDLDRAWALVRQLERRERDREIGR